MSAGAVGVDKLADNIKAQIGDIGSAKSQAGLTNKTGNVFAPQFAARVDKTDWLKIGLLAGGALLIYRLVRG